MIRRFLTALIVLGVTATAALAQGTKWPERPVRVIVPFAAGGPNDVVARLWVDRLTLALGQQFIVDNRGGASGMIGSEAAARAARGVGAKSASELGEREGRARARI